jgi:phospholipase C
VISPWTPSGVNHETYDHASVSATLSTLFGTPNLTDRDLSARNLLHLLNLSRPRDDTPSTLRNPAPTTNRDATERSPVSEDDPLPENDEFLQGFLGVALVTRLDICAEDEAARQAHIAEALAIRTRGHARRFLEKTHTMVAAARASGNQGSPADM